MSAKTPKTFRKQLPRNDLRRHCGKTVLDQGLGWKRNYLIDGRNVEIVLGSDGEIPTADMTNTAADWARHWSDRRADVIQYIAEELSTWHQDWSPTVAHRLELSSIHVLWPESPTSAMLYFDAPNDNVRSWHVTYLGREPKGFAFDDQQYRHQEPDADVEPSITLPRRS